jgi:hypothetical protein
MRFNNQFDNGMRILSCIKSQGKYLILGGSRRSQIFVKWVSCTLGLLHKLYIALVVKFVLHWKVVCPRGSSCMIICKDGGYLHSIYRGWPFEKLLLCKDTLSSLNLGVLNDSPIWTTVDVATVAASVFSYKLVFTVSYFLGTSDTSTQETLLLFKCSNYVHFFLLLGMGW